MKRLKTLMDVITHIKSVHGRGLAMGVNCYSSLRDHRGNKTVFSVTKGAQFTQYTPTAIDALQMEHVVRGLAPKRTIPKMLSHTIYLSELRMINVYETFVEFLSTNKIDFMYAIKNGPTFTILGSLNILPPAKALAQWAYDEEELENNLEYLGKTVIMRREESVAGLDFS